MTNQTENLTTLGRREAGRISEGRTQQLLTMGGIIGALAAMSCCVVPLALFALGVSGAWIANLTRLAPYQPYFIAATLACLGGGYWLVYRSATRACAEGEACTRPLPNRIVKIGLVFSTTLVIASLAVDYLAPLFYR
jgi:mercuric ion transport protein